MFSKPKQVKQESTIQGEILNYLKSIGAYTVKVHSATKSGVPDILVCLNGKFIAFEVKKEAGIVSQLQAKNMLNIIKAGGLAIPVYSLNDVIKFLSDFKLN